MAIGNARKANIENKHKEEAKLFSLKPFHAQLILIICKMKLNLLLDCALQHKCNLLIKLSCAWMLRVTFNIAQVYKWEKLVMGVSICSHMQRGGSGWRCHIIFVGVIFAQGTSAIAISGDFIYVSISFCLIKGSKTYFLIKWCSFWTWFFVHAFPNWSLNP